MHQMRKFVVVAVVVALVSGSLGAGGFGSPAGAASGPVFTVMNTSETPPDGVYFRNSPRTADTNRITGLGVYMNERVQLACYAFGDAVGQYNDSLWYFVLNVSRPTNNGATNQGYLNAHYINDGQNANVIDAGVPACGAPPPPPPVPNNVKSVVNADGGVYWRSGPDWSQAVQNPGHGVYTGDKVTLSCWVRGGTVPPYNNNPLWYQASIYSGRGVGSGYVNDHFLDTGTNQPNIPVSGVPTCGSKPPPASGAVVYYSPYGSGSHLPDLSSATVPEKTIASSDWSTGSSCSISKTVSNTPTSVDGRQVSTLAGWSLGRDGVLYELEALNGNGSLPRIKYVLLIDPGGYKELQASCDASIGSLFATWLKKVPDAHLVILSGPVTLDYSDPVNGHASAGIQNYYFNAIRSADSGGNLRSRVLVCNYLDPHESVSASHNTIYASASHLIGQSQMTSCPGLKGMNSDGSWNP